MKDKIIQMLLNQVLSALCGNLWRIAQQWVAFYENEKLMTGEEKRAQVINILKSEAANLGMQIGGNLINFAIEAAIVRARARS